jgi:peptidoglycan hydrolase-like protein with peptidoglycan-binding domain
MILKLNSKGTLVEQVQKVVGVSADGSFGPKTEAAVKAWQAKNGLTADGIVGPATLAKMGITVATTATPNNASTAGTYSKDKIEAAVKAKGYKWFEGKDYHLNLVGVRNSDTGKKVTNVFDDKLTLSYQVGGQWDADKRGQLQLSLF